MNSQLENKNNDTVQNPDVSQQIHNHSQTVNVIVSGPKKSVGVSLILTLFFGPLGMLYSTILGGLVMMVITVIVAILTAGFGLLVTQPICMVWGAIAASQKK